MRIFAGWVVIIAGQLTAGPVCLAAATVETGPPLLVAVEAEPGFDLDAQEIRKAISAELGRKIVSPAATASTDAPDVLLVALSRARLVISFRGHADEQTVRSIPMPADHAARLRAVAWMAGNLARDQIAPLILATAGARADHASPSPATAPIENQAPAGAVTQPAPWSAPTLPTASTGAEAETLRRQPAAERSPESPWWTVTAAAGLAAPYSPNGFAAGYTDLKTWQIELQNHRPDRWLWGGAVDFGPLPHHLGYALTAGQAQRWRSFSFDETAGLGLESTLGQATTVTSNSMTGVTSETRQELGWSPYARLFVTAAHPLWRSWDVVLRLGAHFNLEGTLDNAFLAGTVGLSMRLP
ncbi:MAG TPA: hypothetical protein VGL59_06865 [Polyangia bacterium]|jgi:hypothetical protein